MLSLGFSNVPLQVQCRNRPGLVPVFGVPLQIYCLNRPSLVPAAVFSVPLQTYCLNCGRGRPGFVPVFGVPLQMRMKCLMAVQLQGTGFLSGFPLFK